MSEHDIFYIAGPMRGIEQFNFPLFFEAEAYLGKTFPEATVFNPARHDIELDPTITMQQGFETGDLDGLTNFSFEEAMRWDLARVLECTSIVLLPGWENSTGAQHEVYVADVVGAQRLYYVPNRVIPVGTRDPGPLHHTGADYKQVYEMPKISGPSLKSRRIIGITGKKRAGKDTMGAHLVNRHGFTQTAFADPMRKMLLALDPYLVDRRRGAVSSVGERLNCQGWEELKAHPVYGVEYRRLMQRLGTEGGRAILGENVWVDAWKRSIEEISGDVVVTDVRFDNEAQAIIDLGGVIWEVRRTEADSVSDTHASEAGVSPGLVSRVFHNDSDEVSLYRLIDVALDRAKTPVG